MSPAHEAPPLHSARRNTHRTFLDGRSRGQETQQDFNEKQLSDGRHSETNDWLETLPPSRVSSCRCMRFRLVS